jgi:hypothetical protein
MADHMTGRHRMRRAFPAWMPDRPTAEAWLRQWWIAVVSAALILFTVVTVGLLVTGGDPDRRPTAAPAVDAPADTAEPAGSGEPTSTPTSVAPTTPANSPSASRAPAGAVDLLAAFAATTRRLVDSGDLDRKAGRELQRRAASIAQSVQSRRSAGAVERLRDLDERLADLREDGKLSRAGFQALDLIDLIIAALG